MANRWGQGNTRAQQEFRDWLLAEYPVCQCRGCPNCKPKTGCEAASTDDDHIKNRAEGGGDEPANHQALCHPCHGWKTKQEALRGNRRKPTARRPQNPHPSGIEL